MKRKNTKQIERETDNFQERKDVEFKGFSLVKNPPNRHAVITGIIQKTNNRDKYVGVSETKTQHGSAEEPPEVYSPNLNKESQLNNTGGKNE